MGSSSPLAPEDPRAVGGYRLLRRLGAGGMGVVYLARSPGERLVAVKTVQHHLARDPGFRRRFRREVEAVGKVSGAYTASLVDADPDADPPWLATVYPDAPSLAGLVEDDGALSNEELRRLAGGLAEALAAVHRAGLVHRDLKPSNVLMLHDGPRLIDFGIAQNLEATAATQPLTQTGAVIGSPGYISPERLDHSTGRVAGQASDVFALGAVLCFAATGIGPFGTASPEILHHRTLVAEPDLNGIGDVRLRELIRDCLAKNPDERPTPAQIIERLHPVDSPPADTTDPQAPVTLTPPLISAVATKPATQPRDRTDASPRLTRPKPMPPPPLPPLQLRRHKRPRLLAATITASVLCAVGGWLYASGASNGGADAVTTDTFAWSLDHTHHVWGLASAVNEIIVADGSTVTARNPSTGSTAWTWQIPANETPCEMAPDTAHDRVLVDYGPTAAQCNELQAISTHTGKPLWPKASELSQVLPHNCTTASFDQSLDGEIDFQVFCPSGSGAGPLEVVSLAGAGPAFKARTSFSDTATGCSAQNDGLGGGLVGDDQALLVACPGTFGQDTRLYYTLTTGTTQVTSLDLTSVDTQSAYATLIDGEATGIATNGTTAYLPAGWNLQDFASPGPTTPPYTPEGSVLALDMTTGRQLWVSPAHGMSMLILAASATGAIVLAHPINASAATDSSGGPDAIYRLDPSTGAATKLLDLPSSEAAAFDAALPTSTSDQVTPPRAVLCDTPSGSYLAVSLTGSDISLGTLRL